MNGLLKIFYLKLIEGRQIVKQNLVSIFASSLLYLAVCLGAGGAKQFLVELSSGSEKINTRGQNQNIRFVNNNNCSA